MKRFDVYLNSSRNFRLHKFQSVFKISLVKILKFLKTQQIVETEDRLGVETLEQFETFDLDD